MALGKSKSLDMTSGVIWRQIVEYAIPILMGNLLQEMYTVVDSITVGQLVGKEALAAVSATEFIVNIAIGMFIGISMGATIVVAQKFGSKVEKDIHGAVHTTFALTLIIAVIITIVGVLYTPLMLRLMSTPNDVFDQARQYLTIYFAGISGQIIYNMSSGVLRAVGDSRRPLIALVITSLLNIALDLLLVAVFGLGVKGVAIATIVSQMVSAVYLCYLLLSTEETYRLRIKDLSIDRKISKAIFAVGIPIGLQKTIISFSNTMITGKINYFGSSALAGWGVYRKIEQMVLDASQSISLASSTFVGQNVGAGDNERAKKGTRVSMIITLLFTIVVSTLSVAFRRQIVMMFNSNTDVIEHGAVAIASMMPYIFMNSIYQIISGELRGYGESNPPMIVGVISYVVLRQIYLNIFWKYTKSLRLVYSGFPIGWLIAAIIITIYLYSARKKREEII